MTISIDHKLLHLPSLSRSGDYSGWSCGSDERGEWSALSSIYNSYDENDFNYIERAGAVYLSKIIDGVVIKEQKIVSPKRQPFAFFGSYVTIAPYGRRLFVAAYWHNGTGFKSGAVFVYFLNEDFDVWEYHSAIYPPDGNQIDSLFGWSMMPDYFGKNLIVGTPFAHNENSELHLDINPSSINYIENFSRNPNFINKDYWVDFDNGLVDPTMEVIGEELYLTQDSIGGSWFGVYEDVSTEIGKRYACKIDYIEIDGGTIRFGAHDGLANETPNISYVEKTIQGELTFNFIATSILTKILILFNGSSSNAGKFDNFYITEFIGFTDVSISDYGITENEIRTSQASIIADSNSSPISGARMYKDIETDFSLSSGEFIDIFIIISHIGTGGDWSIFLSPVDTGLSSNVTRIKTITSPETNLTEFKITTSFNVNKKYLVILESNVSNDGGAVIDFVSVTRSNNLTQDGNFLNDVSGSAVWFLGAGCSIGLGHLLCGSATSTTEQPITVNDSEEYYLSYEIFEFITGVVTPFLTATSPGVTRTSNGTYFEKITASSSGSQNLIFSFVGFSGKIRNVRVTTLANALNTGAGYLIKEENGVFNHKQKFTFSNSEFNSRAGHNVAISGDGEVCFMSMLLPDRSGTLGIIRKDDLGNFPSNESYLIRPPETVPIDLFACGYASYLDYSFRSLAVDHHGQNIYVGAPGVYHPDDTREITQPAGAVFWLNGDINYNYKINQIIYPTERKNLDLNSEYAYFGLVLSTDRYGQYLLIGAQGDDEIETNSGCFYLGKRDVDLSGYFLKVKAVLPEASAFYGFDTLISYDGKKIISSSEESTEGGAHYIDLIDNSINHSLNMQDLLITDFKDKEIIRNLIISIGEQLQEIEQICFDLKDRRSLDVAEGQELDLLGAEVGLSRAGKTDDQYRSEIAITIQLNISGGQPEILISTLSALTSSTVIKSREIFPATFEMFYNGSLIPSDLVAVMNRLKPAGVKLIMSTAQGAIPFVFDLDGDGLGYSDEGFLNGGNFSEGFE